MGPAVITGIFENILNRCKLKVTKFIVHNFSKRKLLTKKRIQPFTETRMSLISPLKMVKECDISEIYFTARSTWYKLNGNRAENFML